MSCDEFLDRIDTGRQLGVAVSGLELVDPVVLALPQDGVRVGAQVAAALRAPLDVLIVRKVGHPGSREYGVGAIAEGGVRVADPVKLRMLRMTDAQFHMLANDGQADLERCVTRYRSNRPLPSLSGRDVVIVEDGLAGLTAEAAAIVARRLRPARVVLAVPVCGSGAAKRLERMFDAVLSVARPQDFTALGRWYKSFEPMTDQEVLELIDRTNSRRN